MLAYYKHLSSTATTTNQENRTDVIRNSITTMNMRYTNLVGFEHNDVLYNEFLDEKRRKEITRWRLSNHNLRIQTGRFTHPKTPRNERICTLCNETIEDEHHVLFECIFYDEIRSSYRLLLEECDSIPIILNPRSKKIAYEIGSYIIDIEKRRELLGI